MTPQTQLRMLSLSRVWVAGFLVRDRGEFDLNGETVRLLRARLATWSPADVVRGEPLAIDSETRFSDEKYWREHGEERGFPLIVTGSLRLVVAPPSIVQRGRRTIYLAWAGRTLDATVVLIDGRTGQQLTSRKLPSQMRYGEDGLPSALALYSQMMERSMPEWLNAITRAE